MKSFLIIFGIIIVINQAMNIKWLLDDYLNPIGEKEYTEEEINMITSSSTIFFILFTIVKALYCLCSIFYFKDSLKVQYISIGFIIVTFIDGFLGVMNLKHDSLKVETSRAVLKLLYIIYVGYTFLNL
jgi:hypothetical protein